MPLIRLVNAPGLLTRAQGALGMTQAELGVLFGVSRRTMIRWQGGHNGPLFRDWVRLVGLVYARNRDLAAEIAVELGETLVSLGVEAAPAPATAFASSAGGSSRATPRLGDLVDSIVCAAAEAISATPQAVRPALLAAFDRTASVGLGVDEVRGALRPVAAPKTPD